MKYDAERAGPQPQGPLYTSWGRLLGTSLLTGGALFAGKRMLSAQVAVSEDQLIYLKRSLEPLAAMSGRDWRELVNIQGLGHFKTAPLSTILMNYTKRFEESMGGIPRTFGIWPLSMEYGLANTKALENLAFDAEHVSQFKKFYEAQIGRSLTREELQAGLEIRKAKKGYSLFARGGQEPLLQRVRIAPRYWDLEATQAGVVKPIKEHVTRYGQAIQRYSGVKSFGKKIRDPFIAFGIGSENIKLGEQTASLLRTRTLPLGWMKNLDIDPIQIRSALQRTGIISQMLTTRYMQVLDEPFEFWNEMLFSGKSKFLSKTSETSLYKSLRGRLGTGFNYVGTTTDLWIKHLKKAGPLVAGLLGVYAVASELGTRTIGQTPTQVGARVLANTQIAYSEFSKATGLQSIAQRQAEMAPGSTSPLALLGASLSMGMTAMAGEWLYDKIKFSGTPEQKMVRRALQVEAPEALKKIPLLGKLFSSEMGRGSLAFKIGSLAGAALMLPFIPGMLGAEETPEDLKAQFAGVKWVPVKKGRKWEAGRSPYEGGEVSSYRPNLLTLAMKNTRELGLYGEDYAGAPVTRFLKSLIDPYWNEKRTYFDRPYPYTVGQTSMFGPMGSLYNLLLGPLVKPPAYMHSLAREDDVGVEPNSLGYNARDFADRYLEAVGLPGFALATLKEQATGSQYFAADYPVLANADWMGSASREFYEAEMGGAFLLNEGIRRFIPKRRHALDVVNPIPNEFAGFLPGRESYRDFSMGDPYMNLQWGEARLPGEGYSSIFPETYGLEPDEYPDIYKFHILANAAPYSAKYRDYQKRVESQITTGELPPQAELLYQSGLGVRQGYIEGRRFADPATTLLGQYYQSMQKKMRLNPLEHLTPFAPAHKFMGPPTADLAYLENEVLSGEMADWSTPIASFIKPAINVGLYDLGYRGIPSETEERRERDAYFDALTFERAKALDLSKEARRTFALGDIGSESNQVQYKFSRKERPYFNQFGDLSSEKQAEMMRYIPQYQAPYFIKKGLGGALTRGGDVKFPSTDELTIGDAERERSFSEREMKYKGPRLDLSSSTTYAPTGLSANWGGFDKKISVNDIKVKIAGDTAAEVHEQNIWDKALVHSKKVEFPTLSLAPLFRTFSSYNPEISDTMSLEQLGAETWRQTQGLVGFGLQAKVDLYTDRRGDIDRELQNLGFID